MVVVHTWWMNGWRGWRSCMDGGSHAGWRVEVTEWVFMTVKSP